MNFQTKGTECQDKEPFVLSKALSPSDLIRLRCEASKAGEFDFIYDSFSSGSNFLRHFPCRKDYLDYAHASLKDAVVLTDYKVLGQSIDGDEARVLFRVVFQANGESQSVLELAHLNLTSEGWRYLFGEKVLSGDLSADLDTVTFEEFEAVKEKVVY